MRLIDFTFSILMDAPAIVGGVCARLIRHTRKTAKDLSNSQQIRIVPGWDLDPQGNSLRCMLVLALVLGEESFA